jgi:lipoprotein-anchoring transpeptidase ErfK/SrfK
VPSAQALRLVALSLALGLATLPTLASAQTQWSGGGPVFQSDVERQQREREAQRKQIRAKSPPVKHPPFMQGGDRPKFTPEVPPIVYLERPEPPGLIIVDTQGRRLLFVLPGNRAYAYPITVGRDGFTWTGTERISRIQAWPSWTPPAEMRQRQPNLPITVSGGILNPMGARALYLGSSIYRIHGTNNDSRIGRASSSGCFRMTNPHIEHLNTLVKVGTQVRVVASYSGVSETAPIASLFSGFTSGGTPATPATKPATAKKAAPKKAAAKKDATPARKVAEQNPAE